MANEPIRYRRVFEVDGRLLADPDDEMSDEEVIAYYAANGYPQLTNAVVSAVEVVEGRSLHRIGQRGAARAQATPTKVVKTERAQGARG